MTVDVGDEVLHGVPRVTGTRIGVVHVYDMVVRGAEPAEVADALDIDLGLVYEALAYYYNHPDEMRAVRKREAEALEDLAARAIDPPVESHDVR